MNRAFDNNGTIVSASKPEKSLRLVKKYLMLDSGDRDTTKYLQNNDIVFYLPRVYENIVSIRLMAAEIPASALVFSALPTATAVSTSSLYYLVDLEGLNKTDECAAGASRSGFPDGYFAKIPVASTTAATFYNDNSEQENIATYYPPIGKLDRMRIRMRLHSQKASADSIYWASGEYSLSLELTCMENSFDSFSSFETRISNRAGSP
jgi:hypothetical protein